MLHQWRNESVSPPPPCSLLLLSFTLFQLSSPSIPTHPPVLTSSPLCLASATSILAISIWHDALILPKTENTLIFSVHGMPNIMRPWNKHLTPKYCSEAVQLPTLVCSVVRDCWYWQQKYVNCDDEAGRCLRRSKCTLLACFGWISTLFIPKEFGKVPSCHASSKRCTEEKNTFVKTLSNKPTYWGFSNNWVLSS